MKAHIINPIIAIIILFSLGIVADAESAEVKRSGSVVYFLGGVEEGDSERLSEALTGIEHPIVFLVSGGGSVAEGLKLTRIIAVAKANTFVPPEGYCLSICSMMWAAGVVREIDAQGVLGVHQPYGMPEHIVTQTQIEYATGSMYVVGKMMELAIKLGLDLHPHFWAMMLQTPGDDMHIFSFEEEKLIVR